MPVVQHKRVCTCRVQPAKRIVRGGNCDVAGGRAMTVDRGELDAAIQVWSVAQLQPASAKHVEPHGGGFAANFHFCL